MFRDLLKRLFGPKLLGPRMLADPYPFYARLRSTDPVHWADQLGGWVLTRYADIVSVLRTGAGRSEDMTPTRTDELEPVIAVHGLHDLARHSEPARDDERIERLTDSWPHRANVRKSLPDATLDYDPEKPDFLPELLPFFDHSNYQKASEEFKRAALACAWIAYNEKTVAIESKIVSPACMHLIDGEVVGFHRHRYRPAVSQALVDESFHILLVVQATNVTRQRRQLGELRIPSFELVTSMQREQENHPEKWKKILIQLATAVVSEVLVSNYLSLLSSASGIQPLNRITTEIHRHDESAHNGLFKSLGAVIYNGLSAREREFFVGALAQPSVWFASPELDAWEAMLRQIGFPGAEAMIADCRAQRRTKDIHLDLRTLDTLLADLGVENRFRSRVE